jgi:hypothetical protein
MAYYFYPFFKAISITANAEKLLLLQFVETGNKRKLFLMNCNFVWIDFKTDRPYCYEM